jgi:prepilin-type N-terminal cleavage/methylation domain-containing protein
MVRRLLSSKTITSSNFLTSMRSNPQFEEPRLRSFRKKGMTLVETMVAVSIASVALSGLYILNSTAWLKLRATLESGAASQTVIAREESVRDSTFSQITDPTYLANTLYSAAPNASGDLASISESIDVTAYLAPTGTVTPIRVTRSSAGVATIANAGDGTMSNQPSVRVDLTVSWTPKGSTVQHSRQATLIASQGGILGRK